MSKLLIFCACCLCGGLLTWQSLTNAPTSDEVAQLTAGVATARTGDPGFYRVNPPLHRLVSGSAVELCFSPKLQGLYSASLMMSGARHEFNFAESVIDAHATDYHRFFYVGRLVRIPLVLLAGWLLLSGFAGPIQPAANIAAVLWFSSPMVLGHGWAVMPDAFSGAAMVLLMVSSLSWLQNRLWLDFFAVGFAWGLAIGTKFTFCPIYLLWPMALLAHQWTSGKLSWLGCGRLLVGHLGHGIIALAIVIGLYGGADVGVTLKEHSFQSERMVRLTDSVNSLPSPFPKQFLVGIDEQQLDLERGYPTYVLGEWYPDGAWWYYLAGLLIKEQIVFTVGLAFLVAGGLSLLMPTGLIRSSPPATSELRPCFVFCLMAALIVLGILSVHSRMALNVRYAFPALPPLYLGIGIGVVRMLASRPVWLHRVLIASAITVIAELAVNCPHYFAYANPMFGGSYRVPPVLHDSNFDGGQDLWRLEAWLEAHPIRNGDQRYTCVHSHLPASALAFSPDPPPAELLERMIASRRAAKKSVRGESTVEIIVMRGLGAAAPWTRLAGASNSQTEPLLQELLKCPPDHFITPTLAIYHFDGSELALP